MEAQREHSLLKGIDRTAAQSLPALAIAGEVNSLLLSRGKVVVTAPPGAGKSTLLPLTILNALPGEGKILMLEPRRVAARQVATRMATLLGEKVGQSVGYRIRFESKVSSRTRIEVLTEGILTRMLVDDPTLEGVSVVIFDEFHERSLNSDLALALVRQSRELLRDDLGLVLMSATIDAQSICSALDAPLVRSEGRMYPVRIEHSAAQTDARDCATAVARTILEASRKDDGDILAFLPGEAEIRRCEELLRGQTPGIDVLPLYGALSSDEQNRAIAPSGPGERKIVLATNIAETSLTIEGIRIVVDSGLHRKVVFDPQTSLSRIQTVRISLDMADQRAGRAGRVAPGVCYRLWTLAAERQMQENRVPEILEADLCSSILDISAWGENDALSLPWLTPPPAWGVQRAAQALRSLGAVDRSGRITPHGRKLSSIPCHPRIAQMLLKASDGPGKALAADIAAILEEKDPMGQMTESTDITLRLSELRRSRGRWSRISRIAEQYRKMVNAAEDNSSPDPFLAGRLISTAFPERIAKSLGAGGRYALAGGDNVCLSLADDMSSYDYLAVAGMNSKEGADGRVFLCAPVSVEDLAAMATVMDNVSWDSKNGRIAARREWRVGRLVVDSRQLSEGVREKAVAAICEAAAKEGTGMLDFNDEVGNLQRRISAVSLWHPEMELPDVSTDAILRRASEWLPFYIGKASSVQDLKRIDLTQAIWSMLSYEQQKEVERLAPSHIEVPTGSRIKVEYRLGAEAPVLRVRLQECFGLLDTPRVDGGARPVLMELLSPGFKPVQLTTDLKNFWQTTYFDVRKELRMRYPKHSWPENPLEADPVRGVRRKKE